ncbi:MAG: hypothetical protein ACYTAF_11760, partial [Planctomycetota bacterium]
MSELRARDERGTVSGKPSVVFRMFRACLRRPALSAGAFALAVLVLFWIVLGGAYTPHKDEHRYIRNVQDWFSGEPATHPAFSAVHAVPAAVLSLTGLPLPLMLRLTTGAAMVGTAALLALLCLRLHLGRAVAILAAVTWAGLTNTLVAGAGMLGEPMSALCLVAGIVLLNVDGRSWKTVLAGGVLLGLASSMRIEYVGVAFGFLVVWLLGSFRERWAPALAAGVLTLALFPLAPVVDWALGGPFHLMRSHPAANSRLLSGSHFVVTYAKSLAALLLPDLSRTWPYPIRLLGAAGLAAMLVYRRREGWVVLAAVAGASAVCMICDAGRILDLDELLSRYFYLFMGVVAIPAAWSARFLYRRWRPAGFAAAGLLLLCVPGGVAWYAKDPARFWPVEFHRLAGVYDRRLDSLPMLAQKSALSLYLQREVEHTYTNLTRDLSPEDLRRHCEENGIGVVIAQERWAKSYGVATWVEPALRDGLPGFEEVGR